ncbi:MAG: FxsA family protein [Rhodomicrobium sp.]
MPFIILFLLLSWPVLEVASIVAVAGWIGPFATFLLLAASLAFGAFLIRTQSRLAALKAVQRMREGSPPEQSILESATAILAGVLFMIPGFVSDIVALFLLVPRARQWIWRVVSFAMAGRNARRGPGAEPQAERPRPRRAEDVIDVEYTEVRRDQRRGEGDGDRGSPWQRP